MSENSYFENKPHRKLQKFSNRETEAGYNFLQKYKTGYKKQMSLFLCNIPVGSMPDQRH